jgi:hypothetical protein
MANTGIGKASLSSAALVLVVGCSSPAQYSAPQSFTVGNDAVAKVVQDAVSGSRYAAQIEGSPNVMCAGRTNCIISYSVQEPSHTVFLKEMAADEQLFTPTAQVWKALFADPQFQSGTVTVRGPYGDKRETAIYFTLTCNRTHAAKIDWDSVDGHRIRTQCDYAPQTQGLPEHVESPQTTG